MQERILTPDQVSQILQVHPFTVLKFIKQGKLKASKLGRVYRIRETDLEYFLDHTSGRTQRSSELETNEALTTVLKIKNKNKSPLNSDRPNRSKADSNQKSDLSKASTQTDQQNEILVSQVDQIESKAARPKTTGDDHYFILK